MSVSIANYQDLKNRVSQLTRQRGAEYDGLFADWLNEVLWGIENGDTPLRHTYDPDVSVSVTAGSATVNVPSLLSAHPFTVVRENPDGSYSAPLRKVDASNVGPVPRREQDRGVPVAYSFGDTDAFRTTQITLYPAPDTDTTLHISGYFTSAKATWAATDSNYLIVNEPLLLIYGIVAAVFRHWHDEAQAETYFNLYQRELMGNQPEHGIEGFMIRQHKKDVPAGGNRLDPYGRRFVGSAGTGNPGGSSSSSGTQTVANAPPVHVGTTAYIATLSPKVGWLAYDTDQNKLFIYRETHGVNGWTELTSDAVPDHTHDDTGGKELIWFFDDETFTASKFRNWHEKILVYSDDNAEGTRWNIPALGEDDEISVIIFNAAQDEESKLTIRYGFTPGGESPGDTVLHPGDMVTIWWLEDSWEKTEFKHSDALTSFTVTNNNKTVTFKKRSDGSDTGTGGTITLPDDPPEKATQADATDTGAVLDNDKYMTAQRVQERINVMVKQWARMGQPDPSFGSATPDASDSVKGKWRYATSAEALGSAAIPAGVGIEGKYIPRWVRNSATTVKVPYDKLPEATFSQQGAVMVANSVAFTSGTAERVVTADLLPSWVRIQAGKADSAAFIAGTTDRVITADVLPSWVRGTTTAKFNKYLADCTEPTANTLRFTRIDGTTFDIAVSGSSSGGSIPRAATESQIGGVLRARNSDFTSAPTTAVDGRYATPKQIWDLIGTRVTGSTNPLVPSWARAATNPLITAASIAFNTTGASGQIVLTLTRAAGNITSTGTALPTGTTNRFGVVQRVNTGDYGKDATGTAKYMTPAATVALIKAQTASAGAYGTVRLATQTEYNDTGTDNNDVVRLNIIPDWIRTQTDPTQALVSSVVYASPTLTVTYKNGNSNAYTISGGSGGTGGLNQAQVDLRTVSAASLTWNFSGAAMLPSLQMRLTRAAGAVGANASLPAALTTRYGAARLASSAQFIKETLTSTEETYVPPLGAFPAWLRKSTDQTFGTISFVSGDINIARRGGGNEIAALPFATKAEAEAGTDATKIMNPLRTKEAIAALATGGSGTATAEPVLVEISNTVHTFDLEDKWDEWKNRRVVFQAIRSAPSQITITTGNNTSKTKTYNRPSSEFYPGGSFAFVPVPGFEVASSSDSIPNASAVHDAIVGDGETRYFRELRLFPTGTSDSGGPRLELHIQRSATGSRTSGENDDFTDEFERKGVIRIVIKDTTSKGDQELVLPMALSSQSGSSPDTSDPYTWLLNTNLTEGDFTGSSALVTLYDQYGASGKPKYDWTITFELGDEEALGEWVPANDDAGDTITFYSFKGLELVFASKKSTVRCVGGGKNLILNQNKTKVGDIVSATEGKGDPFTLMINQGIWFIVPLIQNVNNFEVVGLPITGTAQTNYIPNVVSLKDYWDNWKNKTVYLYSSGTATQELSIKPALRPEGPYEVMDGEFLINGGVVWPGAWDSATGINIISYYDSGANPNDTGGFPSNRRYRITDTSTLDDGTTRKILPAGVSTLWLSDIELYTRGIDLEIVSSGTDSTGGPFTRLSSHFEQQGRIRIFLGRSTTGDNPPNAAAYRDPSSEYYGGKNKKVVPRWVVYINMNGNTSKPYRWTATENNITILDVRGSTPITYKGATGLAPMANDLTPGGQAYSGTVVQIEFLLPEEEALSWTPPAEDAKKKITFVPLTPAISVKGYFPHVAVSGTDVKESPNISPSGDFLAPAGERFDLTWLGTPHNYVTDANALSWLVNPHGGGKEQEVEYVETPFPDGEDYSLETKWNDWKDKIVYLLSPRDTQHLSALNLPLQTDQLIDYNIEPPVWSWVRSEDSYFGIDFSGEWGDRPGAPSRSGTDTFDYTTLQVKQPKLLRNQGDIRALRQVIFWKTARVGRVQVDFVDKLPKTTDSQFTGNQDGTSSNRRLSDFFEREGIIRVFIGPQPSGNAAFVPKYQIVVRTKDLGTSASSDYDWDPSVDNGVIYRWNSAGGDWDDVFTAGGGSTAWEKGWDAIHDEYTTSNYATHSAATTPKVTASFSVPAHEADKWKPPNDDAFKKITFVPLYNGTSLRGDFSFVTIEKEANGHIPGEVDPANVREHFINIQNPGIPFELTWTGTANPFYLGLSRVARAYNWMVKPLASGVATPVVEYIDDAINTFDLKQKWPVWKDRTVYLALSKDSTSAKEVRLGVTDYQTKQAHTRYLENMDRGLFHAESGGFSIRSFAEGGSYHRGAITDSEFTAFGNNTPLYIYRINVYENSVAIQATRNATYTGGALTLDRFSTKFQNDGYLEITLRHTAYGYIYKFRIYMRQPTGSRTRLAFEGDATDNNAGYTRGSSQLNQFVKVYDGANNELTRTTILNTVNSWGDFTASATIKFYLPETSTDSWIPIESDARKSIKFFPLYNNMVAKAAFPSIINGQTKAALEEIPNSSEPFDLTFTGTEDPYRLGTTKRSWVISSKSDPEGPVGQLLAQTGAISIASYSPTFTQASGAQGFESGGIYSIQSGSLYYYCRRRIPNQVGFWITMENSSGKVVAESGSPLIGYPQGESGGRGSGSPFGYLYLYDVPAQNEHVRFKLYVTEQGSTENLFCSNIGLSGGTTDGASATTNSRALTYTVKIYEWIQPS